LGFYTKNGSPAGDPASAQGGFASNAEANEFLVGHYRYLGSDPAD
jgi:hypothetical protein